MYTVKNPSINHSYNHIHNHIKIKYPHTDSFKQSNTVSHSQTPTHTTHPISVIECSLGRWCHPKHSFWLLQRDKVTSSTPLPKGYYIFYPQKVVASATHLPRESPISAPEHIPRNFEFCTMKSLPHFFGKIHLGSLAFLILDKAPAFSIFSLKKNFSAPIPISWYMFR